MFSLSFLFAVQSNNILRNYATIRLKNIPKCAHFNFFCAQIGHKGLRKQPFSRAYYNIRYKQSNINGRIKQHFRQPKQTDSTHTSGRSHKRPYSTPLMAFIIHTCMYN